MLYRVQRRSWAGVTGMAQMTGAQGKVADGDSKPAIWLWILAVTLCANAVLLWLGLTEDALTVGKTLKKGLFGISIRLVDERQTFSIISAIFKLRSDGNYFLFFVIFLFSIVFPIVKWAANALIWVS